MGLDVVFAVSVAIQIGTVCAAIVFVVRTEMRRKAAWKKGHRGLGAGTLVHVDGVPLTLTTSARAFTSLENWARLDKQPEP